MTVFQNALSLDGGGIKGIIQASLLSRVEIPSGLALSGTSIGSGNAALLATGVRGGDLEDIFLRFSARAFSRTLLSRVRPWGARHDGRGLDEVLEQVFGDVRLNDVPAPLFVTTAWQTETGWVEKVLDSVDPSDDGCWLLREACRASMAAPVEFPALSKGGLSWVDGGVWCGSPSVVLAVGLGGKMGVPFDRIRLFSMGNGHTVPAPLRGGSRGWTPLKWAGTVLRDFVPSNIRSAHKTASGLGLGGYCRFEEPAGIGRWGMSDWRKVMEIRREALRHLDGFKRVWYGFWDGGRGFGSNVQ